MSVKGLDTFLDVFDLIKNPEKYEAKIAQLRSDTAQYKEAVEAVVALSEVNDFIVATKKREETSKIELEEARKTAAEIKAKASEMLAKAKATSSEATAELEKASGIVAASKEDSEKKSKEQAALIVTLNSKIAALEKQSAFLDSEKAALKEKQEKLSALLK